MKVKNFIASDMSRAMQMVRAELGPDAVILSTVQMAGEVHLTAAIEEGLDFEFTPEEVIAPIDTKAFFDESNLRAALEYHGVVEVIRDRLLALCREAGRGLGLVEEQAVLQTGLERMYDFRSLLDTGRKFKLFMGTPGSGKSTAMAKLATLAKMRGIKTALVSTDNSKAGANQQLKALADILEVDFSFFKDPRALFKYTSSETEGYGLVLIDTPGINPFVAAEIEKVSPFADAVKADKILTMDAGRNVYEAIEAAEIFAEMNLDYLLPTRLDLTRRLGAVLSVAGCCNLALCSAGVSASIASGLAPVTSASLAKLILS